MKKTKIKVVKIGRLQHNRAFKKIQNYKSALFEVDVIEKSAPNYDRKLGYSQKLLTQIVTENFDSSKYDMCIGITETKLLGNFLGIRLKDNNVYAISLYQADEFLKNDNNSVFNYVVMMIYRFLTQYKLEGESIAHDETCGCIFDMCKNKRDIVISCNYPIICYKCETKVTKKGIDADYISTLKKELKTIHKAVYYRILEYIKRHPFLSVTLFVISNIALNVFSSYLYDLIKEFLL